MRAALLLVLAGCAAAEPTSELRSLVAHPATLAAMPGPGPHRGVVLVGVAEADLGTPEALRGREGTRAFLAGRTRVKVVDGVLHFAGALLEKDFQAAVGRDARVAIEFSGGAVAAARLAAGPPIQGTLGDYHPVWK